MSNTTNDEQAPYGAKANPYLVSCEPPPDPSAKCKPTERAPMLSDRDVDGWIEEDGSTMCSLAMNARQVRDFYEAKITSGELRVVKTCKYTVNYKDYKCCSACDFKSNPIEWGPLYGEYAWKHCPGCGSEIVK